MIRMLFRDYIAPGKHPRSSLHIDPARKERELAAEHVRRFQQWQHAASFRSLYTCV